jgi:hypothetical protein
MEEKLGVSEPVDPLHRELLQWRGASASLWGRFHGIPGATRRPLFEELRALAEQSTDLAGKIAKRFPSLPARHLVDFAKTIGEAERVIRKTRERCDEPDEVEPESLWSCCVDGDYFWTICYRARAEVDAACSAVRGVPSLHARRHSVRLRTSGMSLSAAERLMSIRTDFDRIGRIVKASDGDFGQDARTRRQLTLSTLAGAHDDVWRAFQSRSVLEPDVQLGIEKARRLTVQASGLSSREFSPQINQDAENHFVEGHTQASDEDKARLRKWFRLRAAEDEKERVLDQFADQIDPSEIESIVDLLSGAPEPHALARVERQNGGTAPRLEEELITASAALKLAKGMNIEISQQTITRTAKMENSPIPCIEGGAECSYKLERGKVVQWLLSRAKEPKKTRR